MSGKANSLSITQLVPGRFRLCTPAGLVAVLLPSCPAACPAPCHFLTSCIFIPLLLTCCWKQLTLFFKDINPGSVNYRLKEKAVAVKAETDCNTGYILGWPHLRWGTRMNLYHLYVWYR